MATEHNLESYETVCESFDWGDVYAEADWDAPGSINVAREVCDRHVAGGDRIVLRQVGVDGESDSLTFEELAERTNEPVRGSSSARSSQGRLSERSGDRNCRTTPPRGQTKSKPRRRVGSLRRTTRAVQSVCWVASTSALAASRSARSTVSIRCARPVSLER
jgi:hypothetical protein